MQTWQGGAHIEAPVVWFKVPREREWVPRLTPFRSAVHLDPYDQVELGEIVPRPDACQVRFPPHQAGPPFPYTGAKFCGSVAAWRDGAEEGVDPIIFTESDGYADCCGPRPATVIGATSYVAVGAVFGAIPPFGAVGDLVVAVVYSPQGCPVEPLQAGWNILHQGTVGGVSFAVATRPQEAGVGGYSWRLDPLCAGLVDVILMGFVKVSNATTPVVGDIVVTNDTSVSLPAIDAPAGLLLALVQGFVDIPPATGPDGMTEVSQFAAPPGFHAWQRQWSGGATGDQVVTSNNPGAGYFGLLLAF